MNNTDRLLTQREACKMLNVSRSTLYRMIEAGKLERIQPAGRAVRVRLSDVEAIMAGNKEA